MTYLDKKTSVFPIDLRVIFTTKKIVLVAGMIFKLLDVLFTAVFFIKLDLHAARSSEIFFCSNRCKRQTRFALT